MNAPEAAMERRTALGAEPAVLVWDLPTRVFHWAFAAGFAGAFVTLGDDRYLDIHVFAGYLALAAIAFRIVWGFMGGHYARFAEFAHGWPAVRDYVRGLAAGRAERHLGHNPAGSWAIFLMLGLGLAATVSGVALLGAEEGHGPLAGVVPLELDTALKWVHENLSWLMLGLVGIHVVGVLVESVFHRESLTLAMITGSKPRRGAGGRARHAHLTLGAGMLVWVLAFGGAFFRGAFLGDAGETYRHFEGPVLAQDQAWRTECGDCHLAFHPNLLPERSWRRMLAEQDRHFGEDLALDGDTLSTLEAFAVANAADLGRTEFARKLRSALPADDAPLAITATPVWQEQHRDVETGYWSRPDVGSRANCGACHLDAEMGTFEDAAMRLPQDSPRPRT